MVVISMSSWPGRIAYTAPSQLGQGAGPLGLLESILSHRTRLGHSLTIRVLLLTEK